MLMEYLLMSKYKEVKKIIDHVKDIETTCDEATIKQIVCILISRLLNPLSAEETGGLIAGLAEAEQEAIDMLESDKETLH